MGRSPPVPSGFGERWFSSDHLSLVRAATHLNATWAAAPSHGPYGRRMSGRLGPFPALLPVPVLYENRSGAGRQALLPLAVDRPGSQPVPLATRTASEETGGFGREEFLADRVAPSGEEAMSTTTNS